MLYRDLLDTAGRIPDAPAFVSPDGQVLDFAKVASHVTALAVRLGAEGIKAGDCVATLTDNDTLRALLRIALLAIGADVPVVFQPAVLPGLGQKIDRAITFSDQDAGGLQRLDFEESWFQSTADFTPAPVDGRLIFSTSGSTGLPKFLRSSPDALLALTERAARVFGIDWQRQLVMVPDNTLPATNLLLRSIRSGHLYLSARATPAQSLVTAHAHGVRQICVTPMSLRELVDAQKAATDKLRPSVITMFGAMADRSLMVEATDVFGAGIDVFYGTAENGLAGAGRFDPATHVPGWCGDVAEGTEVIIRPNGRLAYRIPETERAEGYLGGDRFLDEDDWFETTDLATLLNGKTIVLHGRDDNLINLGGSKFAAELVELLACQSPGVSAAAATLLPERSAGMPELGVAVVAADGFDAGALQTLLALRLRTRAPITVVTVDKLPALPGGKIDRRGLPSLF